MLDYFILTSSKNLLVVLSQNIINGSVPVGESLTALDPSKSPTPNTTIVWHAQDVNSTSGLVPAGSKVTLTADRGLVLADPRGQRLWSYSLNPSNGSV
ncbi:hypothetical protein YC2023_025905 [Brassica napus]